MLFFSLAIIFPVFITARSVLGLPQGMFIGVTGLLFIIVIIGSYISNDLQSKGFVYVVTIYLIGFAFLNTKFAIDSGDAQTKWIVWILTVFTLLRLTVKIDQKNTEAFMDAIPWIFFIGTALSVILTIDDFGKATSRNNSVGLYAGAAFISAFYKKGSTRYFLMFFSAIFIYGSSSRAAVLGTILAALPVLFYSMRLKRFYLYLLPVFILIVVFFNDIENLTEEFFQRKATAGNAIEALLDSKEQREYLFQMGAALVVERPYLGYGLGDGYIELIIFGDGEKTVHNGYLTTFIEVGVPFSVFIFTCIGLSIFNLFRDKLLGADYKIVTLSFMLYILARAYGENYLVFNSANNVSIIFLTLVLIFLFKSRKLKLQDQ